MSAMLPFGDTFGGVARFVEQVNHQLIAWAASLGQTAAAFIAALALVAAVVGARRPMVRVVAAAVGLLLGLSYAERFVPWLEFLHLSARDVKLGLGASFAIFGVLLPEGITFMLGGLLCGTILASFFPSNDRTYAFLPAFLAGGGVGVVAFPLAAALVSSYGGGLVCAAALAALLPRATLGGYFLTHPWVTAGVGLAIGTAGLLGQLRASGEEILGSGKSRPPTATAEKPAKAAKKRRRTKTNT